MKKLYVAHQDSESREWIPVAVLEETEVGYELRYTMGASRCIGFSGFGRMSELDRAYLSPELFPFFANRLISRARPEFESYMRWVGLPPERLNDPMSILAVTGGVRATDAYELFSSPASVDGKLGFDFFVRGIRYLPGLTLSLLAEDLIGSSLRLMLDVQNEKDSSAVLLRTEKNMVIVGYTPRYYCSGILDLLTMDGVELSITVKRVNMDAPLDMRVLCSVEANGVPADFNLMKKVADLQPWTKEKIDHLSEQILKQTNLDIV